MTRKELLVAGCGIALLVGTRSWYLPSGAPTWLRGASPFTWSETRRERQRCLAFADMIGSQHPQTYYADEDRKASPVMSIDRAVRAGDSLAFDGRVTRGRYLNYVFHCATANFFFLQDRQPPSCLLCSGVMFLTFTRCSGSRGGCPVLIMRFGAQSLAD